MEGQNTANILVIFLMAGLIVLGIILMPTLGRTSYAFFGVAAVLGVASLVIRRRRR